MTGWCSCVDWKDLGECGRCLFQGITLYSPEREAWNSSMKAVSGLSEIRTRIHNGIVNASANFLIGGDWIIAGARRNLENPIYVKQCPPRKPLYCALASKPKKRAQFSVHYVSACKQHMRQYKSGVSEMHFRYTSLKKSVVSRLDNIKRQRELTDRL
jgi:hypothetical protein